MFYPVVELVQSCMACVGIRVPTSEWPTNTLTETTRHVWLFEAYRSLEAKPQRGVVRATAEGEPPGGRYFEPAVMALITGVAESCFWASKNVSTRSLGEVGRGV